MASASGRQLRVIGRQLADLRELCQPPRFATACPAVSAWSLGQHVEHLMLADRSILDAIEHILADDDPRVERDGRPSLLGSLALALGRIPRGRGEAPSAVIPASLGAAEVSDALAACSERLHPLAERTSELDACRRTAPHPALGRFRPGQWLAFIRLHHDHHLRIVGDIERAASST